LQSTSKVYSAERKGRPVAEGEGQDEPGGKAIIALPSTAHHGTVSRIQAALEPGVGVVTSRGDVHSVVTEYGVAELWGRSVRERALALISIAHPDFRGELLAAAKERRFVFLDQDVPRAVYPWSETRVERLPKGEQLRMRPVRITDERPLQEFLYGLSDESIYRRFMLHKRAHPREELQDLVAVDFEQSVGMVAEDPSTNELIGVIRYDLDRATQLADIAFIVRDDWQGKGVGTAMMRRMIEIGKARGLFGFTAEVLLTNTPALALFSEAGLHVEAERDGEVMHLVARFQNGEPKVRPEGAC
jgi:RimJ/RimL family protein N-acetyltransferase